jgi:hypothetical protein
MELIYRRCSGLDVHKESISVCVLLTEEEGPRKQIRRFGTMTRDLLELGQWLRQMGVAHVAIVTLHTAPHSVVARHSSLPGLRLLHSGFRCSLGGFDRAFAALLWR